jgi:hypothetical protein
VCQRPSNFDATLLATQQNFSPNMPLSWQHDDFKYHIAFRAIWNGHCKPDFVSIPALSQDE